MSSVNKVIVLGNVGKDPEGRHMQNGDLVVNLSVATSEQWTDKQSGEKKTRTEWHRVVIFGPVAEVAQKYLRKGSKVYLEGQLQTRKWQDQQGNDRYSTEVVLRPYKGELVLIDRPPTDGREDNASPAGGDDLDDQIPF